MASFFYNRGKYEIFNRFSGTTSIHALLVTTAYTPDITHQTVANVAGSEASGTGYTRKTLSNVTITMRGAPNNDAVLTADDLYYSSINAGVLKGVVFYINTLSGSTSNLIGYYELPTPITTNTGPLTISIPAGGIRLKDD